MAKLLNTIIFSCVGSYLLASKRWYSVLIVIDYTSSVGLQEIKTLSMTINYLFFLIKFKMA